MKAFVLVSCLMVLNVLLMPIVSAFSGTSAMFWAECHKNWIQKCDDEAILLFGIALAGIVIMFLAIIYSLQNAGKNAERIPVQNLQK